jgi:hypothetical protein
MYNVNEQCEERLKPDILDWCPRFANGVIYRTIIGEHNE